MSHLTYASIKSEKVKSKKDMIKIRFGSSMVLGMKVLPFYLLTFLLLMLSGCIEEFEADIPDDDSDLLVVEGTICSERLNKFYLSRTQPIHSDYIPRIIMSAEVSVRGSDGSEYKTQAAGGYYTCQLGALNPDVAYYLHIEFDGEEYESEPQKPLRTEKIARIRGVQNSPESNIDVLVTPAEPFDPDRANYYSWTYDETWEVYPDCTTEVYFDTEVKKPIFWMSNPFPRHGWIDGVSSAIMVGGSTNYEGQHIKDLKMFDIDQSDERIFHRYSGLVHQRAISKAEYEYELARRQASSEMGGLFTPQPSSLPTNVRCLTSDKRAIGFVGCSLNSSDYRFFLNASDFTVSHHRTDPRLWLEDCNEDDCCQMVYEGWFLCVWEDSRMSPGGTLRTGWASVYQLDVRYKGAYIERPDFWSLEENVSY